MTQLKQLSVIIPVFNEAETLPVLLNDLKRQQDIDLDVVVVDGGSNDNTKTIAEKLGARVFDCKKGRALQLNAGAQAARCADLLFLHADSSLTDDFLLSNAYSYWQSFEGAQIAGHFALDFVQSGRRHQAAFRYLSEKSASNRPFTINGDQGLLISRQFFQSLGGYNVTMPIMEDQVIANEIFKAGRWIVLPGCLNTSGRRFEREGFHRRYILMSLMMGLYWTGAHQFFIRAKNIYVDQQDAEKLKLWPFFICIWQMLINDFGFKKSLVQWFKVGRYVRQNAWQLFFMTDVSLRKLLGPNKYPFTRFYDKVIYLLTSNSVVDVMITPIVFIWFMLILGPFFFLFD